MLRMQSGTRTSPVVFHVSRHLRSHSNGASEDTGDRDPNIPSVDARLATELLPFVLSMVAGNIDAIGFLELGGLFPAHITGNLVKLAEWFIAGGPAPVAHLISVPIFIATLALTRLIAAGLERFGIATLKPLLLLHFIVLVGSLMLGSTAGPHADSNSLGMIVTGMLGVSAMAVQSALTRICLAGAPSTTVMTTNITLLTMDLGEILLVRDQNRIANATKRARNIWPAILGFLLGCVFGGAIAAVIGLKSLVLPVGFALLAWGLGRTATQKGKNELSISDL